MKHKISVVIPVYNTADSLEITLNSIRNQSFRDFEVIVIDDSSTDNSIEVAEKFTNRIIINKENKGPAVSRNKGIRAANSNIIAFIDSDCIANTGWLKNIAEEFKNSEIDCVMGNTKIPKSNFLGDSIACLGYPGGANVGFENMWPVDRKGFTNHITSCNFAARKEIFKNYGLFDEDFPLAGGEDPELSYRWSRKGVNIKYCPNIFVYHEPTTSFKKFIKWMVYRGRGNYYFKKRVIKVGDFVKLRIWSSKNIIVNFLFDSKIFLIIPLLFLMFVLQQIGYFLELYNSKK